MPGRNTLPTPIPAIIVTSFSNFRSNAGMTTNPQRPARPRHPQMRTGSDTFGAARSDAESTSKR